MRKQFLQAVAVVLMVVCRLAAQAQPSVVQVEYFVDTDPGPGNATAIAIAPAAAISNQTFSVNTTSFSEGLHTLVLRAKDATGAWSLNSRLLFLKPFATPTVTTLQYAEYFIDADPGFGNATEITGISGNTNVSNALVSISTAALGEGLHTLVLRAKDANGNWSLNTRLLFLKPFSATASTTLQYAEYFVDADPGLGNATEILGVGGSANVSNTLVNVNTATLSEGLHTLVLRAKDANGNWSLNNRLLFLKPSAAPAPVAPITRVEYFIDRDSGLGKGISLPLTASSNISDAPFIANLSSLLAGPHAVFIRAMDANGSWSLVNRLDFTVQGYCPGSVISFTSDVAAATYQWQADTTGTGNFINITDDTHYTGTNNATLSLTLPTSFNRYVYRCVTGNGISSTFTVRFASTWTGIIGTAWENTGNWNCGSIPDANTDVLIGSNKTLIVNNTTIIKSLTISKGSTIQVKTGTSFKITGQ